MLPALLTSLVILPGLLLAAFMASDSGTPEAIRGSYIAILLVIAYTGSVFISMLVWEKAALLSGILLSLFTIGNVATAIYLQTTSLLIAFIPWYELGLSSDSLARAVIQALAGAVFGVIVPALSAWRLFRHAFELDVVDHSRPVELWDLKSINNK